VLATFFHFIVERGSAKMRALLNPPSVKPHPSRRLFCFQQSRNIFACPRHKMDWRPRFQALSWFLVDKEAPRPICFRGYSSRKFDPSRKLVACIHGGGGGKRESFPGKERFLRQAQTLRRSLFPMEIKASPDAKTRPAASPKDVDASLVLRGGLQGG